MSGEHRDWLREHGEDRVEVLLIDLLTLVARMEQAASEPGFETQGIVQERIWTCDLPRLKRYLPAEALEVLR